MIFTRASTARWLAGFGLVHALVVGDVRAESMPLKVGAGVPASAARSARATQDAKPGAEPGGEGAPKPRTRRNGVTVAYDKLKKSWHVPASAEELARYNAAALPPLVFRVVHDEEEPPVVLIPSSDRGDFSEEELEKAKVAFKGKPEHPGVNPRTLSLVYRAMRHFHAPYVHLISGIRPDRGGSRHTHGHAADIVLPGVSDETLADYFRTHYGFVGVGMYTRAGFVHIDTREESFYWLDRSLPGKKGGRIQPIMKEEAAAADVAARARGEEPYPDPPRLVRALKVRLKKIVKANKEKRRVKAERMAQAAAPSAE